MAIILFFVFLALIFPLVISVYLLVDFENKKVYFAIFLFRKIKIVSGYIKERLRGGYYLHTSKDKAIILDKSVLSKIKGGPNLFKNFDITTINFIADVGVKNVNVLFSILSVKKLVDAVLLTFGFNNTYKNIRTEVNIHNKNCNILYLKLKFNLVFNLICILKSLFANYISEVKYVKKKFKQL